MAGTATNQYGFYSLTLPAGEVEITYSYVGYNTRTVGFRLSRDTVLNINLGSATQLLQEVVVTAGRTAQIQETTQMSAVSLPVAQIKALPAFLGEVDVLKALQLMPGIQSGNEGSSGLYVRGGGPDQNLILLDGVPVYNVSHLFGFFSVFNADAVNNMEVFKGGFPARYGGRVSSVVDINMKEGNMQRFHGEGSVGLVATKMMLEGPVVKDKTSFIVSGRRTYIDALAAPIIARENRKAGNKKTIKVGYYFYDFTAKINHRFSEKDRIYLSAYMGDDKFYSGQKDKHAYIKEDTEITEKSDSDAGLTWGNITAAFRWNHIFTNKLFGNTTLTYSRFRFDVHSKEENTTIFQSLYRTKDSQKEYSFMENRYNSSIQDWCGKMAFDWMPSPNHHVRFGANAIYHTFNPSALTVRDTADNRIYGNNKRYAWETAAYFEDDIHLTKRLKTNIGLHWSSFAIDGKFYHFLQPRVAARYLINPQLSAKASYSRMAQYVHLLTNSSIGLPTDFWVPTTPLLRPQTSHQTAVGLAKNYKDDYEISVEGYYKTMANVMEYKEGANFLSLDGEINNSWEQKILQGDGRSYGVELFVQKKTGSYTGWVGYTLSWTDRRFDELNGGKRFFYKYDRRHDVSVALVKRFSDKIEASGTWVFGSGNCVTVPIGIYEVTHPMGDLYEQSRPGYDRFQYDYGERNGYRMKPYHRLDLSVAFIKAKKWGERRWVLGVYNAYNRKNPFYIDVIQKHRPEGRQFKYVQYSLFPIIPSISYNFKF